VLGWHKATLIERKTMDLNKVMLIGRLTRDPEMRTTPQGTNVVSFSVATGFTFTDASGAKQERTEFTNCVAWRKLADIISQYLKKGRQVYIEGRLQTRTWDGQDGKKNYRTEVVVENMIMLGSAPGGTGNSGAPAKTSAPSDDFMAAEATPIPTIQQEHAGADEEITVEDIPF
jgi:single-strand DNA-binding protein